MTAVDERVETIEYLDFDATCAHDSCENTADFFGACRFCGTGELICNDHLKADLERDKKTTGWQCTDCLEHRPDLLGLIDFRPIRGGLS